MARPSEAARNAPRRAPERPAERARPHYRDPGPKDARGVIEDAGTEELVVDARASLSPAQLVEQKLLSLLDGKPMPYSQLLATARPRRPGRA